MAISPMRPAARPSDARLVNTDRIKGTPLEDNKVLSEQEIESSITEIAKILSPEKIRLAGDRIHLKDSSYNLLKHSVSALITGDMATTTGCKVNDDINMVEKLS